MPLEQAGGSATSKIIGFFRNALNAIGIDIFILGAIILLGLSLSLVYTGANDFQTSVFAVIFSVLAVVSLAGALLNKFTIWNFFHGSDYAIDERISLKRYPVLGLVYFLVFVGLGLSIFIFFGPFIASLRPAPSSVVAAPDFLFQGVFSPIVEEYFWRGLLQPIFVLGFLTLFVTITKNSGLAVTAAAFICGSVAQIGSSLFIHSYVFQGQTPQFQYSFAFDVIVTLLSSLFGIIPAIAFHMGHNLGMLFSQLQSIFHA